MKLWQIVLKRIIFGILLILSVATILLLWVLGILLAGLCAIVYPIVWLVVGRSWQETIWLTYLYVYDMPTARLADAFHKKFGDI